MPRQSKDHSSDIIEAQSLSNQLLQQIRSFPQSEYTFRAPIIDKHNAASTSSWPKRSQSASTSASTSTIALNGSDDRLNDPVVCEGRQRRHDWCQTEIMGWNRFTQSIEKQIAFFDQQRESRAQFQDSPLPPILALITMWKTVNMAVKPITGVRVSVKGKEKEEGVVDVMCRGGAEWIKLWTKKEGQLLAEFREQDSYINSDWSDSDSEPDLKRGNTNGKAKEPSLNNSLIEMARSLLSIAETAARPPGFKPPKLTIRLTKLRHDLHPEEYQDERISKTFDLLKEMGVNLVSGDYSDIPLSKQKEVREGKRLLPSLKINLDPTALVGLCCDGLHHPLPKDEVEAKRRYFRPRDYLHEHLDDFSLEDDEEVEFGATGFRRNGHLGDDDYKQSQHSRELYKEAMEEMRAPLIEELRDTLGDNKIEFWATKEAVRHLREAFGNKVVVGEGMEQQRMRRLLGDEPGNFFEGSRYEGQEGCLKDMSVRVLPDDSREKCEGVRSFHQQTSTVIDRFLSEYHQSLEDSSSVPELPTFLRPDKLPVPKVANLTLPLPISSLISIARGSREGMTTLCMGGVVWRELWTQRRWAVRGWSQGNYELEGDPENGNAVMWLMPYRSLGEGKRTRFERGDYTFPLSR